MRPASTLIWLAAALAGAAGAAHADMVTSRAALGGDDQLRWDQLDLGFGGPAAEVATEGGRRVQLEAPVGGWQRLDQAGPDCGTFRANFAPCEALLLSANSYDPATVISVSFAQAVAGGGAAFSSATWYGPFTATIAAYDAEGALLETWSLPGTTTGDADGSAPFLGVRRGQADIARLDFSGITPYLGENRFVAIGTVEILGGTPPIPEPSTLLLMAAGLAGVALRRRQRAD